MLTRQCNRTLGTTAFALYNEQDAPLSISTAPLKVACIAVTTTLASACGVRDLWAGLDYTVSTLPSTVKVAPHATELYRVHR